ncbi:wax ester/triacylglycerol synthase domain-containing protein [Nocardioides limicola]|uniref:wax ester/triacylglycerol synthase domain-containing protein n=1 Tax=Nocardioides limicola TaxID=2803368 RepID=UPI00193B9AB2|nr:wax ester/triacylglycerol synthase domain-containing protein [Nocardioides sp. DJM-14]
MIDLSALTPEEAWAVASTWGREPRMNELETLMWRSDRHPVMSSTGVMMMLLDSEPDWDRLVAAHEWGTRLVPRFRDRVLEPVVPVGPPAWVPDDQFALDYHLRRTSAPDDGSWPALLAYAESFALAPLDRDRPLWEAVLVTGLRLSGKAGMAALLLKMHHSLTDGMGGIQLFSLVQSRTRKHTPKPPVPELARGVSTDPVRLAAEEVGDQVRRLPAAAGDLLSAGRVVARHPRAAAGVAVRYVGSLRRVLTPGPAEPSPLLRGRTGTTWRFGTLECAFADLRAAGKAAGCSVNDAFVASLLGGLRHYHERHGVEVTTLPMAMPVSLRRPGDPMGGNKFAGALFAGPVGIEDPVERMAAIRGQVLSVRAEPAIAAIGLVAPVANRLPSGVGASLSQLGATVDLSASNVPGVRHQTYVAGAAVERLFAFAPLPGVAVMVGMCSHVGTCCFGFNIDGAAVADHVVLMECFAEGLDEVLAVGRVA